MHPLDDTIAAIASACGGAARGIVRLSGPDVLKCLKAVFQSSDDREILAQAYAHAICGSINLQRIHGSSICAPCDVFLWPAGRSYTGQMVAEFHTLGSQPILDALLKTLCTVGARIAEPGEFTLRAFLSGRIDLTQAEAVLGVIDAADPREFKAAVAQLAGGLAGPLHKLRDMLLDLLAHLEAGFDFADEDLPFISVEEMQKQIGRALESIDRLAMQMQSRGAVQSTVSVVLLGRPNSGKSSLFNALIRKEHALVSDTPGTTRDYLTAELVLEGRKCRLIDTAGIHEEATKTVDAIKMPDHAAQHVAAEQIERASVRLLCIDVTRPPDAWEQAEIARGVDLKQIVVWTKLDAISPNIDSKDLQRKLSACVGDNPMPITSSVTGYGIDLLRAELRGIVHGMEASACNVVSGTAARCHQSLYHAGESLRNALSIVSNNGGEEFIAAEIRTAMDEIGRVVGAVYTDDVLDRIFSRFCVGK